METKVAQNKCVFRKSPLGAYLISDNPMIHVLAKVEDFNGLQEMGANATIISDAFDTISECGIYPSELLKQRNELLETLIEVRKHMTAHIPEKVFDMVDDVIEKTIRK